jgi:hypothetical protein
VDVLEAVAGTAALLRGLGVKFALVGGLAVSSRSEPRFTRDADFAVAVASDKEAESVVRQFFTAGYLQQSLLEQQVQDRLATVRLLLPPDGPVVDLLFASYGIEREIAQNATIVEIAPGVELPVARVSELIAMKLLSESERRPQDRADILGLIAAADANEPSEARKAAALISTRGYNRGRDLLASLDRFIALAAES